jgi:protein-tyrosine phosphatase
MNPMNKKISILFVCMGNICRSPAGEAAFRHLVESRGLTGRFEIDSAGTIGYHAGEIPDGRMTEAAAVRGIEIKGHARQFARRDFDRFDLIVAMDQENYNDISSLAPGETVASRVRMLCSFIPGCRLADVPDPYYGGPAGFERVLDLVQEAGEYILDELLHDS